MSKIVLHGCGGCGSNLLNDVARNMLQGSGFANLEINYIDSSMNNIEPIRDIVKTFHEISSNKLTASKVQGAGGNRDELKSIMSVNVKEYLDKCNYKKYQPDEYHVVMFNCGGGTGSVAGLAIINELMKMGIPSLCVMVGDHGDLMKQKQTLETLSELDKITRAQGKCLLTLYLANKGKDITKCIQTVNTEIRKALDILSVFLNGENVDIDNADMMNMIDMSRITKLGVQPGLYSIFMTGGENVSIPEGTSLRFLRTLTKEGVPVTHNLTEQGYSIKHGYITNQNVLDKFNGVLPIHCITISGLLRNEIDTLKREVDEGNKKLQDDTTLSVDADADTDWL